MISQFSTELQAFRSLSKFKLNMAEQDVFAPKMVSKQLAEIGKNSCDTMPHETTRLLLPYYRYHYHCQNPDASSLFSSKAKILTIVI